MPATARLPLLPASLSQLTVPVQYGLMTTPSRFDARRATRTLLLAAGSLVAGLSAYWLTPRAKALAAAPTTASADFPQNAVQNWAPDQDQFQESSQESEWEEEGEAEGSSFQASPFSAQAQQRPLGRTRAS